MLQIHFLASKNVTEYEALLHGMRIAINLGVRRLIFRGDSDQVVQEVMKVWDTKDPVMAAYYQEVHKLESKFNGLELHHIRCNENDVANMFAKMGSL